MLRYNWYAGLHNPGCVCYMNCLLQQLYMHHPFRYYVFKISDLKEEEALAASNSKKDKTDNTVNVDGVIFNY